MNKLKLFIENFLIYGLGGIISKIIPLIMLPIITRIMPNTTYFGISDMSNTIISFGSALAVMGMYDAMYRMFFEREEEVYKKKVCSNALFFTIITSFVVFGILLLSKRVIAFYFFGEEQYIYMVYLSAMAILVGSTNSIVSAPTRMQNNRKIFLLTNTIGPFVSYAISIPMLLAGYYVIALPLAAVISGATMEIVFAVMNKEWFHYKWFDIKLLKQLLVIAIPLLPNFLVYWIFNSCDRIMITNMLGIEQEGIYSVGAKLGNCSQLIYTAFAGGWQFFAFSTMKEENQVQTNSRIFEYLGIISFVATAFICAWSLQIFRILFPVEYNAGYVVAPYLFLAPLLLMLFQVAANQFLVVKKTWPNMLILSVGAVMNLILNYLLIPRIGIEGAAIATLMGYIISDMICVIVLCKMKLMVVSARFMVSVVVMGFYMVMWRLFVHEQVALATVFAVITSAIFGVLYRRDLKQIVNGLKRNHV